MKFIIPTILIVLSVVVFFGFTNPMYNNILSLRTQVSSYEEALGNSKALEQERDKLTAKYNSIDRDDLAKLQKMVPDNVDNIRLILEIEKIALPYGMALRDVKYNTTTEKDLDKNSNNNGVSTGIVGGGSVKLLKKDYGDWDLEFSTIGTYSNFINFTRDLESNLRIVDISSITFSSADNGTRLNAPTNTASSDMYKYNFRIKTYWLKK